METIGYMDERGKWGGLMVTCRVGEGGEREQVVVGRRDGGKAKCQRTWGAWAGVVALRCVGWGYWLWNVWAGVVAMAHVGLG